MDDMFKGDFVIDFTELAAQALGISGYLELLNQTNNMVPLKGDLVELERFPGQTLLCIGRKFFLGPKGTRVRVQLDLLKIDT